MHITKWQIPGSSELFVTKEDLFDTDLNRVQLHISHVRAHSRPKNLVIPVNNEMPRKMVVL